MQKANAVKHNKESIIYLWFSELAIIKQNIRLVKTLKIQSVFLEFLIWVSSCKTKANENHFFMFRLLQFCKQQTALGKKMQI